MTDKERKTAAKEFAEFWQDKGYEKGESQTFWLTLLSKVLGVAEPEKMIRFESQVKLDNTSFIDAMIPATHVMIEQKSSGKNLRAGILQSDGSVLSPFQQAKRYSAELPYSERPRWIVTCNFQEFLIYDMEKPTGEPEKILLKDLPKEYYRLQFLTDTGDENIRKEMEISIKAGEIVGLLYDALLGQYRDPENPETLKSLNELCVRIVFCLYAEDAGLFGGHGAFHDYLQVRAGDAREALIRLFEVLATKPDKRDPYLNPDLAAFPYVNGGLFANKQIEIPNLDEAIVHLILEEASEGFDWSEISPTIFGAVFESTLNPETRRSGGMHYTSIENIHKVIDPLFLDGLRKKFEEIKEVKVEKTRRVKLREFQDEIAGLTFLDPACGSGNFLTETYISLRKLENQILNLLYKNQLVIDTGDVIKVSIGQFYGIGINDFAVTVAKTALWIAESQMMHETEEIVHTSLDFLPLKSYANIVEGNALRIDWEEVVPKDELDYIMGNPPFVGAKLTSESQRQDKQTLFGKIGGKLDYVACWFKKASGYTKHTKINVAFVSTNSIYQGEQPILLFKPLFESGIHFNFAHRTFRWDSESKESAAVYCAIVGFSFNTNDKTKKIFSAEMMQEVNNINAYLIEAPNVFLDKTRVPICNAPEMVKGAQLIDGGNFNIGGENEKLAFIKKSPESEPYIFEYCNADTYLNHRSKSFCLYLEECPPEIIKKCAGIYERVQAVYEYRKNSTALSTHALMNKPTKYFISNVPKQNSILVPVVSSERRKYIPIGFLKPGIIYSNATNYIDNATLYHFGILTSNVHMAWMRAIAGRLKSDYRYSKDIVYNNFPWPEPTDVQKAKIEQSAQAILDARTKYPDSSLADLYDELTMPPELRKAHQQNDKAVMQAYGFSPKMTESECVAELMERYREITR